MSAYNENDYSPEERQKALALLERSKKQQAKNKERNQNPERKAKQADRNARKRAADKALRAKAMAAGITVSDAEISEIMSK